MNNLIIKTCIYTRKTFDNTGWKVISNISEYFEQDFKYDNNLPKLILSDVKKYQKSKVKLPLIGLYKNDTNDRTDFENNEVKIIFSEFDLKENQNLESCQKYANEVFDNMKNDKRFLLIYLTPSHTGIRFTFALDEPIRNEIEEKENYIKYTEMFLKEYDNKNLFKIDRSKATSSKWYPPLSRSDLHTNFEDFELLKRLEVNEKEKQKYNDFDSESKNRVIKTCFQILKGNLNEYLDFQTFILVAKHLGYSYEEIDSVLIGSSNYDYSENISLYENYKPDGRLNLGSLIRLAQNFDKEKINKIIFEEQSKMYLNKKNHDFYIFTTEDKKKNKVLKFDRDKALLFFNNNYQFIHNKSIGDFIYKDGSYNEFDFCILEQIILKKEKEYLSKYPNIINRVKLKDIKEVVEKIKIIFFDNEVSKHFDQRDVIINCKNGYLDLSEYTSYLKGGKSLDASKILDLKPHSSDKKYLSKFDCELKKDYKEPKVFNKFLEDIFRAHPTIQKKINIISQKN
ncbi:MAG: hypothetical protein OEV44_13650 [Spirochaetota bacterium]|nr:hypothetical protein [Spirochaetota bacterium]